MTTPDVLEVPGPTVGTPTGVTGWRHVVQAWLPENARSVVGAARVGIDPVSRDVWVDLSDYCTGVMLTPARSDFGDHPTPAQLAVTLQASDGRFRPWGPIGAPGSGHRFQSGCAIRFGFTRTVDDVTTWHPRFTGEIEQATPMSADGTVEVLQITAVDTVAARLPKVDLYEYVLDPAADGIAVSEAIAVLLDHAEWPYPTIVDTPIDDAGDPYPVLGRMLLSGNLYDTLRRMGDSTGRQVCADLYGRFLFVRRRPQLFTYSNAHMPAADPNLPAAVTIDTAADGVLLDTCHPEPAEDAIVNAVSATDLSEPGLFGLGTVGDNGIPVRIAAGQNATLRDGLQSSTGQSVTEVAAGQFFRWAGLERSDPASIRRHGRRARAYPEMFPHWYTLFTAEYMFDRLLQLQADGRRLHRITELGFDRRQLATVADLELGAAVTVEHDGATFNGHIAAVGIQTAPMHDRCNIRADVAIDVYDLTRETLT